MTLMRLKSEVKNVMSNKKINGPMPNRDAAKAKEARSENKRS